MLRLAVLDYGLFQVHQNGRVIGIPGFVIQTGSSTILVDTGFPPWYATDSEASGRAEGLDAFGRVLQLTPENLPPAQLARLGLAPSDITHLVLTHTHIDHVGHLPDFVTAEIVVGRAERGLPQPLYWGDVRPIDWPDTAYQLVGSDRELWPGVTVLHTPGHTPGHLSLLVRLSHTGPILLTADAISRPDELAEDSFNGAWNPAQARASAHRLMNIAQTERAWVVYGHDPAQWSQLRKAPAWYE
jgi:N-acyl homoserine lactone hydrolase